MGLFVTLLFAAVLAGPDSFIPDAAPPQAPHPAPQAAQAQPKPTPTDQLVNLSEIEELRAELKAMKEENAKLLRKIDDLVTALADAQAKPAAGGARPGANAAAQGARAAAVAAPPHRNWSRIEIGMTREDVDRFIATHHNLKLIGVSADAGVVGESVETVVRTQGIGGTTVVRRGGPANTQNLGPGTVDDTQQVTDQEQRQTVERKVARGKREVFTVAKMASYRVQNGSARNALGGSSVANGTAWREVGRLRIMLTDDVVPAVEGTQN
jgi:hypothetical protein